MYYIYSIYTYISIQYTYLFIMQYKCGPGSVVNIVTCYGLDGSNPGGDEIFCTCPDRPWGPPSLLYYGYWVFPQGKEWLGRDSDPSPPSSALAMKG
jgi:hypothetical protein